MSDYRWRALDNIRPALVDAFAEDGVDRVEYVAAFPDRQPFAVWLGTTTDAQAERLRAASTGASNCAAPTTWLLPQWSGTPQMVFHHIQGAPPGFALPLKRTSRAVDHTY